MAFFHPRERVRRVEKVWPCELLQQPGFLARKLALRRQADRIAMASPLACSHPAPFISWYALHSHLFLSLCFCAFAVLFSVPVFGFLGHFIPDCVVSGKKRFVMVMVMHNDAVLSSKRKGTCNQHGERRLVDMRSFCVLGLSFRDCLSMSMQFRRVLN